MRRKLAVLVVSLGSVAGLGIGLAGSAHATTVPPVCVHQATPLVPIEVGYCPNG